MKQYSDLLRKILEGGHHVPDRTGVGTTELFGEQIKFDLADGFPLLSGKATNFSIVEKELAWMLSGSTNVNDLDSTIWDNWLAQYTVPREIVEVKPIEKEYEPYNFDLLGAPMRGFTSNDAEDVTTRLSRVWHNVMRRCYDVEAKDYCNYGAKGISVCKRWHQVANFVEDSQKLLHWAYKEAEWDSFQLDKDYYSSNQYGPDTCVWLRADENAAYRANVRPVKATSLFGTAHVFLSGTACAAHFKVQQCSVHEMLRHGRFSQSQKNKDWKFEYIEPKVPLRYALIPDGSLGKIYGHNFRHLESGDQIAELVAGLKEDPHSRRHIVSSWIPESNKTAALAACHALWQVNVANGKINLHMYQRSCDIFLGAAYNIAFYALLLELLAFETGTKAGVLTISFGSVHIYNNHMEQVAEYLSRGRHPLPSLQVDSVAFATGDFDVTLEGYSCGDKIPAPVAV